MMIRKMFATIASTFSIGLCLLGSATSVSGQDRGQLSGLAAKVCSTGKIVQKLSAFEPLKWDLPARLIGPLEKQFFVISPASDCRDGAPIAAVSFRMLLTRVAQQEEQARGLPGITEAYVTSVRGELLQAFRFTLLVPLGCNDSACFIRNDYRFDPNNEARAQFGQLKALWIAKYDSSN